MKNLLLICFLFYSYNGFCQRFGTVGVSSDIRGITPFDDGIIYFGQGLTQVDALGNLIFQKNILEDVKSSEIVDVEPDGSGGLWILTRMEVLRMLPDRTTKKVLDFSSENVETKDLFAVNDEGVYVLLRDRILKINRDNSHELMYQEPDRSKAYYNQMCVDKDHNLYLMSYTYVRAISNKKEIKEYALPARGNLQTLWCTEDGKLLILDYSAMYTLKDDGMQLLYRSDDISRGLNFFDLKGLNSNKYWIYATGGNVFQFDHGVWTNFTPPKGLNTGNLGEGMAITQNGHVWMSLRNWPYFLRYDGRKWHRIELKKESNVEYQVSHCYYLDDNTYVCRNSGKEGYVCFDGKEFKPILTNIKGNSYFLKKANNGKYYYASADGIFATDMKTSQKVVDQKNPQEFGIFQEELFYMANEKLIRLARGTSDTLENNIHFLGHDDIGGLRFFQLFNGDLAVNTPRRSGLISIYNGKSWQKVISIEGKQIYDVLTLLTYKNKSYIITKNGSVAVMDNTGTKWLYYNHSGPSYDQRIYNAFITADEKVWYLDGKKLNKIDQKGIQSFDFPYDAMMGIGGVVLAGDKLYHIFSGKNVISLEVE